MIEALVKMRNGVPVVVACGAPIDGMDYDFGVLLEAGQAPEPIDDLSPADDSGMAWTPPEERLPANMTDADILAACKRWAVARVEAEAAAFLEQVVGQRRLELAMVLPVKAEAARAMVAGTATEAQQALVSAEAQVLGIAPGELAQAIVAAEAAANPAIGAAEGMRRKAVAAVNTCAAPEEVMAALADMKQQAEQLKVAMAA